MCGVKATVATVPTATILVLVRTCTYMYQLSHESSHPNSRVSRVESVMTVQHLLYSTVSIVKQ